MKAAKLTLIILIITAINCRSEIFDRINNFLIEENSTSIDFSGINLEKKLHFGPFVRKVDPLNDVYFALKSLGENTRNRIHTLRFSNCKLSINQREDIMNNLKLSLPNLEKVDIRGSGPALNPKFFPVHPNEILEEDNENEIDF